MAKKLTLTEISDTMRDIDICMLTTQAASGGLESRPMSNNRQVTYEGDSYFFSLGEMPVVKQITNDPRVNLSLVGRKQFYLSISGTASIIRERAKLEKHWTKDIEKWFEQGLDTPGIVLIRVEAQHIQYWNGHEEGEISL